MDLVLIPNEKEIVPVLVEVGLKFNESKFKDVEVHLPDLRHSRLDREIDIYDRSLKYFTGETLTFEPHIGEDYVYHVFQRTKGSELYRRLEASALTQAISSLKLPLYFVDENQRLPCTVMNDNIISNGPRFYDQNGTLFSFKYVHPRIGKHADFPAEDYCMRLDGKWNFDCDAIVKVGLIVRVYEDRRDNVGKLGQIQCIYISNPEKESKETTKYAVVLTDGHIINPSHFVIIYEPINGCDRGYIKNCGYIGRLKDFPHLVPDTTTTTTISTIEEENHCGVYFKDCSEAFKQKFSPIMSHPIWKLVDDGDCKIPIPENSILFAALLYAVRNKSMGSVVVERIRSLEELLVDSKPDPYSYRILYVTKGEYDFLTTEVYKKLVDDEAILIPIPENSVLFAAFLCAVHLNNNDLVNWGISSLEEELVKQPEREYMIINVTKRVYNLLTTEFYTTYPRMDKIFKKYAEYMARSEDLMIGMSALSRGRKRPLIDSEH
jgi:positive regulator of sigma E activity